MPRTGDEVNVVLLNYLRVPASLADRLDAWCQRMQKEQDTTLPASRPMAVRYILDQFLQREEKRKPRKSAKA